MNKMNIFFRITTANSKIICVSITGKNTYMKAFISGENVSESRAKATESKPYIGDILRDLVETYHISAENIFTTGTRPMTKEEAKEQLELITSEI